MTKLNHSPANDMSTLLALTTASRVIQQKSLKKLVKVLPFNSYCSLTFSKGGAHTHAQVLHESSCKDASLYLLLFTLLTAVRAALLLY
jgi:hypothetical protein